MKKAIILFLAIFLVVGLSSCGKKAKEPVVKVKIQKEAEPVEVEKAAKRDIAISYTLSGKLSGVEDVVIMSEISFPTKVKKVNVKLGDKVSKGQVLFMLDDEDIRKQIEKAKAAYELANRNLESQREQIENAKINFDRIKKLYKEGAVSKQQYEQAKLKASDKLIEVLKAQVNQAKVSLDQAYSQLEKTIVKSPINGYAAAINVQENEFITSSQPAMRIVNTDKLTVNFGVSENIINKIKKNMEVNVKVQVATDKILKGIVKAVSPIPDDRAGIYPVEVEIDNKDGLIKPGMFAEITFDIEKVEKVLSIPSEAVKDIDGKKYVYVVINDAAVLKEVEIGIENGKFTQVISGLTENDKVIVKGQDYIENGQKVAIVRGEK
ncbi:efflux RND transporter periplasmic adaptor subunit [Caminicella sporogenes]|uniref:efflux RND transporter periplasmic adaptor subunit n=1 Tax=Caminicella sporogenes TaxID=166485 RepID=UPI00254066D0|nr:efflux RND transporter periplasmic adaptor subunit [Caminicella sporogenes]WIF95981.1 efflux RND transporter periplasmic adaptor subunit [Caminicella sporogenes]